MSAPSAPAPVPPPAAPLVYVADDEPDLAALLAETLGEAGHRVQTFPDAILLDINMPGMTGWEVRQALLADPRAAHVPVIAVTAQGGASTEASALRTLRFDAFLRKPFRLADVLDRVDEALSKKTA